MTGTNPRTRINAALLLRLIWLAIALFAMGVMVAGYADFAAVLYRPCADATKISCNSLQIHEDQLPALATFGFTLQGYGFYALLCDLVATSIFIGTGLLIFWRKSTDRVALFVSLLLVVFGSFGISLVHLVKEFPAPASDVILLLSLLLWPALGIFFYTFPDGKFVPRRSWMLTSLFVLQIVLFMLPYPYNLENWPPALGYLELLVVYGSAAATQVYRYFAVATPMQRQQIKWVAFGFVSSYLSLAVLNLLPSFIAGLARPDSFFQLLGPLMLSLFYLPVPVGVAMALLRYRLWDIDIVIHRALVYAALSACVLGLYVLVVFGLSALLRVQNEWFPSIPAIAILAVIIQPLRLRLQQAASRLMFGDRTDPYRALSDLGRRLEESLPPDELLPAIVKSVAHALKLPYAAIVWQREPASPGGESLQTAAAYGKPAEGNSDLRLSLVHQGEQVGELILSPRQRGEEMSSADLRLIRDLAPQIGIAVYSARLNAGLKKLTVDLQRSRERLVTAREEERRRLRRDLHDGLGPLLSSQTLTLSAVRKLLRHDPAAAEQLLSDAIGHAQGAVADIRRLVYALRPPTLDDLGLLAALQEQIKQYETSGVSMSLDAPGTIPPLPAAIETACYRIVQEALTNVVRHAHATAATVRLRTDSALAVEVSDNGRGLAPGRSGGVGFRLMRERAEELGGSFLIENLPLTGMRVVARLPLVGGTHETTKGVDGI